MENARKGWGEIVDFVRKLGLTERVKICGKVTPIQSEAPLDANGRPLVQHQIPKKQAKVVERGSLSGSRLGTVPGGGSVT